MAAAAIEREVVDGHEGYEADMCAVWMDRPQDTAARRCGRRRALYGLPVGQVVVSTPDCAMPAL